MNPLDFKVKGQGHVSFCLHDTLGQNLTLSKGFSSFKLFVLKLEDL